MFETEQHLYGTVLYYSSKESGSMKEELGTSAIERACADYERKEFFRELKNAQKKVFQ